MVAVLEEYKQARLRQEEERRRLRVNKHHCNYIFWHQRQQKNSTLSIDMNSEKYN